MPPMWKVVMMAVHFWVISHVNYDYEYCDFECQAFDTEEKAEEFIKQLLNRKDRPYTSDCITVIYGKERKFMAKERVTEIVKIN